MNSVDSDNRIEYIPFMKTDLISLAAWGKIHGISRQRVSDLARQNRLPVLRISERVVLISRKTEMPPRYKPYGVGKVARPKSLADMLLNG